MGRSQTDWESRPHFAERFQLFVIIALGESIVVTGATAVPRAHRPSVVALAVAFLSSAALWWLYFGEVAAQLVATHRRDRGPRGARP